MKRAIRGEEGVIAMRYTVISRVAEGVPIEELAQRYDVCPDWLREKLKFWGGIPRKRGRPPKGSKSGDPSPTLRSAL